MKKIILVIQLLCFGVLSLNAQNGYDWGDNKPEAQGNWVYMNNLIKEKQWVQAKTPTEWLLINTPGLHLDLYKQAIKVYEHVVKVEKEPSVKVGLQDTVLMCYDVRIQKFQDNEANVLNRKGLVAYKYLHNRDGQEAALYNLYKKVVTLNGNKTYTSSLYSYMKTTCGQKEAEGLTDDAILDIYDRINEILDAQLVGATEKKAGSILKVRDAVEKVLPTCVSIDCDFVLNTMGPKFDQNPTDLKLAKRIVSQLRSNKCVSNDLYLKAADAILAKEPTVSGYKEKGNVLKSFDRYKEAIEAYNQAAELTDDNELKGDLYLSIASMYVKQGQKTTARTYAQKCISLGVNTSTAHTLIGNLYMYSADDCPSDDVLVTRSIYIAAYNEYNKAGNSAKMAEAKKNFPSMEEIFVRNKKVGDSISTGCWIGQTVQLQKR